MEKRFELDMSGFVMITIGMGIHKSSILYLGARGEFKIIQNLF